MWLLPVGFDDRKRDYFCRDITEVECLKLMFPESLRILTSSDAFLMFHQSPWERGAAATNLALKTCQLPGLKIAVPLALIAARERTHVHTPTCKRGLRGCSGHQGWVHKWL